MSMAELQEKMHKIKDKPIATEGGVPKLRVYSIKKHYNLAEDIILFEFRLSNFISCDGDKFFIFRGQDNNEFDIKLEISPKDLYISSFNEVGHEELKELLYSHVENKILFLYKQWLHEKAKELQKTEYMKKVFEICDFEDSLNKKLDIFF